MIDTAQAPEWYSERLVGEGVHAWRMNATTLAIESFIVTKIHPRSFVEPNLMKSLVASKELLYSTEGLLDLVLIHAPYCWPDQCTSAELEFTWEECWRTLENLKSNGGLVKKVGVSNFDIALLRQLSVMSNTRVSLVQNWCDPFHQDKEVRAFAKSKNIAYMAYSSFGTQWSLKYDENPVSNHPVLIDIAEKHNCTIYEVVVSWLLQEDVIVIPRSSKVEHLKQNIFTYRKHENGPFEWYDCFLDDEDMIDIGSLDGALGSPWD